MFEEWQDSGLQTVLLDPPTQEEIDLVAALSAESLTYLNRESARRRASEGARGWDPGDAEWWEAEEDPPGVDWAALQRRREPTADELAQHPTGASLAFALDDADASRLDDYATVELVAAWYRLTAWAQAGAARAAGELAQRASMVVRESPPLSPRRRRRRPSLSGAAAHEVAMRLTISRSAAQSLIDLGIAIDSTLAPVGDALSEGLIDLPRARAFTDGLAGAPLPVALDVQDAVLPGAPGRTVRQVSADIAKALVSTDPVEASRRHRAARDRRRVCHPTPLPDGMAGLWAVLPAPDAVALDVALDAAARAAFTRGDGRTVDQLRADVLAGIGHAALASGWIGGEPPGMASGAESPPGTGPGADRTPGPAVAVGGREDSPGKHDQGRPRGDNPPSGPSGQDAPSAPPPAATPGGFRLGEVGGRRAQIRVTVPLAVLLPPAEGGESPGDAVAELEGYGPITPDVARAIATGGTWRRLVTDPASGAVRDVGRTRYKPPPELAELVRARDRTCVRPGCGARAQGCDLDHTVPFHLGGHTADWNLGALCASDHALKTAGGFRVEQVEPGVFDFETPSGHVYRRERDGSTRLIPQDRDDGRPPF